VAALPDPMAAGVVDAAASKADDAMDCPESAKLT
jgi:hypothetical protein